MTDFAYVGKKGTGKSKHAVMTMREYLKDGKTVASNIDIDLKVLFGAFSKKTYIRIPDKPSVDDLKAIGRAYEGPYKRRGAGALVMDELGVWFNTRDFADKKRSEALAYLAQIRKFRWDCYYLMQDVEQVDKQLRVSFLQYTVRHTALEEVRMPFVGWIVSALFGKRAGYLPEFYIFSTRLGTNPQGLKTDSGQFLGRDVEAAYDTEQIFTDDYPHGAHSVLSPWHVEGRFLKPERLGFFARLFASSSKPVQVVPKPKLAAIGMIERLVRSGQLSSAQGLALSSRYVRLSA